LFRASISIFVNNNILNKLKTKLKELLYRPSQRSIKMSSGLILAGLGIAAAGLAGRLALRTMPNAIRNMEQAIKSMPTKLDSGTWANSKYYRGGFEDRMTKREASLNNSAEFTPSRPL
jgi:hypothetical protein